MDQHRFDHIARALGAGSTRRAGLRAALGGLLGAGAGAAARHVDADARRKGNGKDAAADRRRRRKRCKPACSAGQTCVKGTCVCDDGGTACGASCCLIGQECQGGQCVTLPEPGQCIPAGEPCKNVGRPCCDGRTCSSGQGGEADIACYVHKTGACRTTADCVYMTSCVDGRCALDVPPPAPLASPCDPSLGQGCDIPGATCAAYDGAGAPSGNFCTLPLNYACTGDAECTCFHCGWVAGDAAAGARARREARAGSGPRLACCGPAGFACSSDRNCCLGNVCAGGTCGPETTCDVCKSGGCPYLTVGDAVAGMPAGSTIRVAPDVYTVDQTIQVGKTITIRPCGAADGVVLESPSNGIISMWPDAGDYTLTVIGTEFRAAAGATYQPTGIAAYGSVDGRATLQVANCAFRNVRPGIETGNHADVIVTGSLFDGSVASLVAVSKYAFGGTTFTATGCTFRNAAQSALYLGNVTTTLTDCAVTGGGGYLYNQHTVGGAIFFLVQGTTTSQAGGPPNRFGLTLAGSTRVTGATAIDSGGGVAIVAAEGAVASLVMTGTSRIDGNAITGPGTPTPDGSGLVYFRTSSDSNFSASGVTGRVTGNTGGANQCVLYVYDDGADGYYLPASDCLPPVICLENAQYCSATSNVCCAGNSCAMVTNTQVDAAPRCCIVTGDGCTVGQTCCDTSGTRSTCQSGTCQVCLATGATCTNDPNDCCSRSCQGTCV